MSKKLTNTNKVQVVSLHLDKTKLRELRFREFLDENNENGINRKESILRMFEFSLGESSYGDFMKNDNTPNKPDENMETLNVKSLDISADDIGRI